MSRENVDRVDRAYDAFNRRDLDAFLAFMDPEVELMTRFMELEGDPYYRGHDGVRRFWTQFLSAWDEYGVEVEELIDAG
jgi:ketosteroid isomerase-like protein